MDFLRWKEVFSCEIGSLCVVPRAPAVITSNGSTAQPRFLMSLIKLWYLSIFLWMASVENLSLVYVNSINCIFWFGVVLFGGGLVYGVPQIHSMSGFRRALHWHLVVVHVQGKSHSGIVLSGDWLLVFPALINVRHLEVGWEASSFRIIWTALLCLCILNACIWGWVQVRRTCFHVSISKVWHSVQFGVGNLFGPKKSCLRAFPIYWLVRNLRTCFICASVIWGFFQNLLESLLSMFWSFVYL
jgi:hypothetical protein